MIQHKNPFFKIVLPFVLLLPLALSTPQVLADDAVPADAGAPAADTSSSPKLQVGVKLVEVSLEHLHDIALDLKHVMSGASHIYDEVNIQPVSLQTMPEVIGHGIVINIPYGTMPSGPPAPPRKARLDVAMHEISPIILQLKSDADEFLSGQRRLDISEDTRTELRPVFESWAKSVTAMAETLTSLNTLTAGPKFDNAAISQAAQQLQTSCRTLQKDLKKVYKKFQKEGRKTKKA